MAVVRDEQDEFCLPAGGFSGPSSNIPPYNPRANSDVDYFNYPRPRPSPPTFSNAKFRSNIAPATGDRKVILAQHSDPLAHKPGRNTAAALARMVVGTNRVRVACCYASGCGARPQRPPAALR